MVRVGEDISERLDIVPAQFFVQRQIRGKWVGGRWGQVVAGVNSCHLPAYFRCEASRAVSAASQWQLARPDPSPSLTSNTQGRSRMRELRMSGSVRGVPSNGHPYRDPQMVRANSRTDDLCHGGVVPHPCWIEPTLWLARHPTGGTRLHRPGAAPDAWAISWEDAT